MRVISGSARGHRLKMVPGHSTRPISDRVKENLFNILGDWVIGTRWLDLFAGTGQVGIEALSRGADHAVFVDAEKKAIRTIEKNLAHTHLEGRASVLLRDAFAVLKEDPEKAYDVVFIAPPQYREIWMTALQKVDGSAGQLLTKDSLVIVQIDPKEYLELSLRNLQLTDRRKYGRTLLCFYEPNPTYSNAS